MIGTTEVLLDGGNPNPIRQSRRPTSAISSPTASSPRPTAPRSRTAARWPTSRSPTAAASAPRSPAGDITEKSTFDVLPFDNVHRHGAERHAGALQGADGVGRGARCRRARRPLPADQRLQDRRSTATEHARRCRTRSATSRRRAQRIASLTLDDGTKIVENGAVVAGAPNVNLATTNFTAGNGDSYPFRDLKGVAAGVPVPAVAVRLHRQRPRPATVTAAQYPVGGAGRISHATARYRASRGARRRQRARQ